MIIDSIYFLGLPGVEQAITFAILIEQIKQYFNNAILIAILIEQNVQMLPILVDGGGNPSIQYLWLPEAIYYQSLSDHWFPVAWMVELND